MRNVDKISFPYRASTHLNLLHVVAESGSWAKHGLDVNYNYQISKSDAHRAVASGEVEFVGGNHISTYAHRARGDSWVYLGQTLNSVQPKLVVRPTRHQRHRRSARQEGRHPQHRLNDWLLLLQRGLDADRDDLELVKKVDGLESAESAEQLRGPDAEAERRKKRSPVWQWVRDGHVDACLAMAPSHLFAADAGLKVIDIEPLPMIWFTTISSSLPFVEKHPDIVERFLKGIIEGIHFFKTQPAQSIEIIRQKYTKEGQLNVAQATWISRTWRQSWSRSSTRPWRRSRTSMKKPSTTTRTPRRSIRWRCGTCITSVASMTAAMWTLSTATARRTRMPRTATIRNSASNRSASRRRWSRP